MRKILITGGPVHAHLDSVKIITNRFRGGLMAQMAQTFARDFDCEVTYLTTRDAVQPASSANLRVLHHQGYFDYRDQVLALAPVHTDVVLGAAVSNLVPAHPWKGKFPSHNYQEGQEVNIPFIVAPRVITQVKKAAPKVNLFGFKLLSDVSEEELVHAAYGVLLDAHATAVIANDTRDLQRKMVVTRERAIHELSAGGAVESFVWELMQDEHYRTQLEDLPAQVPPEGAARVLTFARSAQQLDDKLFVQTPEGLLLGTVAQRCAQGGFWTTSRGKRELEEAAYVRHVDHGTRTVYCAERKATLNAPLLERLFQAFPQLTSIVHGHVQDASLPTLAYAQPGTVRDSFRDVAGSFNIEGHGCFYLYGRDGELLKG